MPTAQLPRGLTRRSVAVLGILSLASFAVVAQGTPSQASLLQPASVSVAVTGGVAYVATPTTVAFTVTNHATNGAGLAAFTLVVPKGIGTVAPVGVTGPGNWREAVVKCSPRATCSSLVVVYGTLPLTQSIARPGQPVTATIMFTTPATAGPLVFGMLGIGGGIFTTTDKPTVNVVVGDAASFQVTAPAVVTAGATAAVTVQALNLANAATPYLGGQVKVQLGTDDGGASIAPTSFSGSTQTFSPSPSSVLVTLPASATGAYTFKASFHVAGQQGLTVTETKPLPEATGTSTFTVLAGPAATITFDSIKDVSASPALPNPTVGKNFVAAFHVNDQYNNQASTAAGDVSLSATGPGSLTAVTSTPASSTVDGAFTDTYSAPSPSVGFTVTLNTTSATSSLSSPVDASGTTATFVAGVAGSLGTANFNPPNGDGTSNCTLGSTLPICGFANLPNGANGQVSLAEQVCTDVTGLCAAGAATTPLVLTVTGNFKNSTGAPLYSFAKPASETLTCLAAVCQHRSDDSGAVANLPEESIEDFWDFPLYIQLTHTEGFAQVPACQVVPTNENDVLPASGGIIPEGNTVGACVDVTTIVRNAAGDVSFTVLFVDDPKTHP